MARAERPKWHPIMQAREYEPGRWVLFDGSEQPYALINFIRRGGELGYRVTAWRQDRADQKVVGYYRSLAAACLHVHTAWINRGVPHGAPNSGSAAHWPKHDDPWA